MTKPIHTFWRLLGEFISAFTTIEMHLYVVACIVLKLENSTSKVLLGDARMRALMDAIKRYYEESEEPYPPALDRAITQLGILNGLRNDLVHWYHHAVDDGINFSNTQRALTRRARQMLIQPSLLEDMLHDVRACHRLLVVYQHSRHRPGDPRHGPPNLPDEIREAYKATFLCKPLGQGGTRDPTPQSDPKPQPLRQSSQALARQAKLDRKAKQRQDPKNRPKS